MDCPVQAHELLGPFDRRRFDRPALHGALRHLAQCPDGDGEAPRVVADEERSHEQADQAHDAECEQEHQAPFAKRVLNRAQPGDGLQNPGHRLLQNDQPVEAGERRGHGRVGVLGAGAGVPAEPPFVRRQAGALGAEGGAHQRRGFALEVDLGVHDALACMPRVGLGDEPAFSRHDRHASPGNRLHRLVRDVLHRVDRQHCLHHPEKLSGRRIVEPHRDVDRPHARRVVVPDLADREEIAPRLLPPVLVRLHEVARGIGEPDVESVAVGEEDLGEVRRGGDLAHEVRVCLRRDAEALAGQEPALDLVDGQVREALADMALVARARRIEHHRGRGPGLGLDDAREEEGVDPAGGALRLGAGLGPGDVADQCLGVALEARHDAVELVGEEQGGGGAREHEGDADAQEHAPREEATQTHTATSFTRIHRIVFPVGALEESGSSTVDMTACPLLYPYTISFLS